MTELGRAPIALQLVTRTEHTHTFTASPPPELPSYLHAGLSFSPLTSFAIASFATMATIHPDSTEDFEFIQTPEAPQQSKPAFDCGVPTTLVGSSPASSDSASFSCIVILVPGHQECSRARRLPRQ